MTTKPRGNTRRWAWIAVLGAVVVTAAASALAVTRQAEVTADPVSAYPMPGADSATRQTQISLRGAPLEELGSVTVRGSRSGAVRGRLEPHGDGRGASFLPARPFRPGEEVSVRTKLNIEGGRAGDYSFRVGRRPAPRNVRDVQLNLPTLPPAAADRFRSRPDLRSPVVRITRPAEGTAPGYVFLAPFSPKGSPRPDGPLITDDRGELVWFKRLKRGTAVTDFTVQRLDGRPVLTWWQGRFAQGWGYGDYVVFDQSYKEIARIRPRGGYQSDLHDMILTPQGTALVLVYDRVYRDLRWIGGPRNGVVLDNVIQEIDLKTGLVLFEWHSLGQVSLEESRERPQGIRSWDYFHVNSVEVDADGNLLISARNTCGVYKISRRTGSILWRLGGDRSDFKMGRGTRFCFQHDARRVGGNVISLYDNSAGPPALRKESRAITLRLDERRKRVRLLREYKHPGHLLTFTQGSMRVQPNGNVFVGWGAAPVFSEFSPDGRFLFNGRLTRGKGNYRAVRHQWSGRPATRPAIGTEAASGDRVRVYASWNGATEVAQWEMLAGPSEQQLRAVGSAPRRGFETAITGPRAAFVAVRARDASGAVLGTSPAVRPGR
jgi:hypothetical protein